MDSLKFNHGGFIISLNHGNVVVEANIEFHETSKSNIWIINPLGIQFDLNKLENMDNKTCHTWEIPGAWSALIQDKINNSFRAICSINNELPWYYSTDLPGYISTSLLKLSSEAGQNEPDPVSICSYIAMDWSVGGYSFIKGIRKSFGGSILEVKKNEVKEKSVDIKKWLGFDNSIQDRQVLVDTFVDICKEELCCSNPTIGLTAGKDTRAVIAGAIMSGLPFITTTGISPSGDPNDVKVARKISEILKIKHIVVDASRQPSPSFEEIYKKYTQMFDSEFVPLNWIIHYKEFALGPKGITRILGYGGEFFTGFYFNVHKRLAAKLLNFNKDTSEKVMQRVDTRFQKMKDLSEIDARDLFYQRERDQFWVSSNIRAMLPYRRVHNPFRDPRLVALGYRFKGGIRASGIHSALISNLPVEVQNLPVNGGKFRVVYGKIKKRLFPKMNYTLLVDPEYLYKVINPELFSKVIKEKKIKKMINTYSKQRGWYADTLHKMLGIQYFFNSVS